ncbi:MAG: transcription termination factor NusA [Candidatus Moranbacteria bacterium]|nr:transcription termination factor NusA [Candidatus Moranbacteria bacterium]
MPRRKKYADEDEAGKITDYGSIISQICDEKGIAKDKVIETIEAALAAAYKKDYGKRGQNIKAVFNEKNGAAEFYLVKEVVDETTREFPIEEADDADMADKADKMDKTDGVDKKEKKKPVELPPVEDEEERLPRYNSERDLTVPEAKKIKKGAKVGDVIELKLEMKKDYGRVAAQTAKQVIIQRIREAERDAMFEEYKDKEGQVISGVVQRVEGRNVFIDLGKSVGVLFPSEQIESERCRIGQRVKVYVAKVESGSKGPGISLSRIHPLMIQKLFELEVPEIFAGTVEIKAIAREAGGRSKIAVASNEEGIDPIGSCVGQKGTRVMAVIDELGGEKIDIVLWDEDASKFIAAALSPAKVLNVEINEEERSAKVQVPDDQLSLAIGKKGQNVRLAAKLTGWKIDILGVKADGETVEAAEAELEAENPEAPADKVEEEAKAVAEEMAEKPKEDKK